MSEMKLFGSLDGATGVMLPQSLDETLSGWSDVRIKMIQSAPPGFTRAELAYLIQFLDSAHLRSIFTSSFGVESQSATTTKIVSPVRRVSLWLPNNVSLLGPLTVVLLSLVGCELRVKAGSQGQDLLSSLVDWLMDVCPQGSLKDWFCSRVLVERFDRLDSRNATMASWADVRILFGSDEAARSIEGLSHPFNSQGFYFSHKVSEAWTESSMVRTEMAYDLARVFGIYGQAGCTSPKRIVIVDGNRDDASKLAGLISDVWEKANPKRPQRHVASETFMAKQWGRCLGQDAIDLGGNSGVAIVGPAAAVSVEAHMAIAIQWGTIEEIIKSQPDNLQTIGHALQSPEESRWQNAFAGSSAVRFVPLLLMHHFGPIWDGMPWWRSLFREKVIGTQ